MCFPEYYIAFPAESTFLWSRSWTGPNKQASHPYKRPVTKDIHNIRQTWSREDRNCLAVCACQSMWFWCYLLDPVWDVSLNSSKLYECCRGSEPTRSRQRRSPWRKSVGSFLLTIYLLTRNLERDQILKGYLPIGASGAILFTSRRYYNFSNDGKRKGTTVLPFDPKQSWDLLLQLLGEDWKRMDREGRIPASEVTAAKHMLHQLEGLALAIQQAAILIKDSEIGGPTIAKTYEMFKEKSLTLPERHMTPRSSSERSLDALWDMTFNSLTRNARALLGVLAWLSPGTVDNKIHISVLYWWDNRWYSDSIVSASKSKGPRRRACIL